MDPDSSADLLKLLGSFLFLHSFLAKGKMRRPETLALFPLTAEPAESSEFHANIM